MSRPVDPFIYPVPEWILNHPETEVAAYFQYTNRFLHDLWVRTGGGVDKVSEVDEVSFFNPSSLDAEDIENKLDVFVSAPSESDDSAGGNFFLTQSDETIKKLPGDSFTGTSYTTIGDVALDCMNSAAADVFLNLTPCDGEHVIIRRQNALITINGPINGGTTERLLRRYSSLQLRYFASSSEWGFA